MRVNSSVTFDCPTGAPRHYVGHYRQFFLVCVPRGPWSGWDGISLKKLGLQKLGLNPRGGPRKSEEYLQNCLIAFTKDQTYKYWKISRNCLRRQCRRSMEAGRFTRWYTSFGGYAFVYLLKLYFRYILKDIIQEIYCTMIYHLDSTWNNSLLLAYSCFISRRVSFQCKQFL